MESHGWPHGRYWWPLRWTDSPAMPKPIVLMPAASRQNAEANLNPSKLSMRVSPALLIQTREPQAGLTEVDETAVASDSLMPKD
jgi:hypothetical protein